MNAKKTKKPSAGQIKGYLEKAREALKGRSGSYDLTQMLKKRLIVDVIAGAIIDGTFDVPAAQLRVVYQVLSRSDQVGKLSSMALFEKGRTSKDKSVREASERALAAHALEGSDTGELAEKIAKELLPPQRGRRAMPMDVRRWTLTELAGAMDASEEEVKAALDALISTNGGSRIAWCREHLDGRYSISPLGLFESLRFPSAFEIENLVAAGDFAALDALLAEVGAAAKVAVKGVPALKWRDGTKVSAGARRWILVHTHTKGGFSQRTKRDAHKAVLNALDLLRDTLDDASARAFAAWAVGFQGKGAPRCLPPHPAAFEEVARLALEGAKVDGYLLDDLAGYRLGRRALLRAEIAWPQFKHKASQRLFQLCHDGWPTPEEQGEHAEAWHALADRFLADAVEAERSIPWEIFAECYLAHPLMGDKVRRYAMETGGKPLTIDADGNPDPASPSAVILRADAPKPAELPPKDETWEQRARRLLAERLGARARVPDFSAMAPFPKTRFANALKPLGFAFELDDVSTGAVFRDVMRAERVLIRMAPARDARVVEKVWVEDSPYRRAVAERGDDGLVLTGQWEMATDFELATIGKALAALGFEPPGDGAGATEGWSIGLSYSQGGDNKKRCLMCRRKLEEFYRLGVYFTRAPKPEGGTAVREWEKALVFVGHVHIACAAEHRPDDLAAIVAERKAGGGDLSMFEAVRGSDAVLVQGKLTRCDACRRPMKKGEWRLQVEGQTMHIDCAKEHHAEALARAIENAPPGYAAD